MRKCFSSCLFILLFVSCLFFKNAVITGASDGLLMWYQYVLPSLLPFMILVNIMIQTDTISLLARVTGPLMKVFPGVSANGSFAVTAGFLCGYPMGAKISADLVRSGKISYSEGAYLLSFCNNSSPVFIISILFIKFIPDLQLHLPFFLILFLSPLICGQFFRIYYTHHGQEAFMRDCSFRWNSSHNDHMNFAQILDHSLMDSFDAIVKVGLYMMIFSILIELLGILIPGSNTWKIVLLSSMEIAAGLSMLANLTIPVIYKYIFLMAATSFGGFCAIFQTVSMIQGSDLHILPYIIEKLITAMVTSLLTFLYLSIYLHI